MNTNTLQMKRHEFVDRFSEDFENTEILSSFIDEMIENHREELINEGHLEVDFVGFSFYAKDYFEGRAYDMSDIDYDAAICFVFNRLETEKECQERIIREEERRKRRIKEEQELKERNEITAKYKKEQDMKELARIKKEYNL